MIPSNDKFTKERFLWLNQVQVDRNLTPSCFRVAFAISQYMNRERGYAYPGQTLLSKDTGLSRSGLRKAIHQLEANGHLHVTSGRGRRVVSQYKYVLKDTEKGHACNPYEPEKRVTTVAPSDEEKGHSRDKKRVTPVATNPLKETSENISSQKVSDSDTRQDGKSAKETERSSAGLFADTPPVDLAKRAARTEAAAARTEAFEKFRAAYPWRPGSNWTKARESFDRAVKRGAKPDEIITGAAAYAGYCAREGNVGERARFIKLPVTWLNQSEWTADYGPVSSAPPSSAPTAEIAAADWRTAVERFHHTGGEWSRARFGPPPGSPGCRVPPEILSSSNQRVA